MLVDPLPGATRDQVLSAIREVATNLINLRSGGADRFDRYIEWATSSAQKLGTLISATDVDRLVLTRRYWALQSMPPSSELAWNQAVARLLDAEIDTQSRLFDATEQTVQREIARWTRPGTFVVPDTSFYIEHPEKLEDMDLAPHLDSPDEPVHLIVPILVIDELDGLKGRGQKDKRWRAAYTLAVLDNRLEDPTKVATLRAEDAGKPRVTVEILFDPPGHHRLPISDDEIIDRTLATQAFADRPITLITYDTGQSTRARSAGLRAVKLDHPLGEEPPGR